MYNIICRSLLSHSYLFAVSILLDTAKVDMDKLSHHQLHTISAGAWVTKKFPD